MFVTDICHTLIFKKLIMSTYHLLVNGQNKRFKRIFKDTIPSYIDDHTSDWNH